MIRKKDSLLDIETKFFQGAEKADYRRTAAQNKKIFMKSYAIKCQIPSLYVLDADIYNRNPRYSFQIVKYKY